MSASPLSERTFESLKKLFELKAQGVPSDFQNELDNIEKDLKQILTIVFKETGQSSYRGPGDDPLQDHKDCEDAITKKLDVSEARLSILERVLSGPVP